MLSCSKTPGTAVNAAGTHKSKIVNWRITPFPNEGEIILMQGDKNLKQ
jgi:hypothetical protein